MECKGASWGPSDSPEGACSPGLTRLMIIEMTVTGQNPAEPGKGGAEGFPPKVWEDTLVRPVATLCDYQERCSFVPRSLVGVPNPFTVLRLRYACRNIVSGAMKLFGPQPPNGGDANAVYTLDCVGL